MKLEGIRALITGGGRGIGAAIADAYACQGADVAIASRTAEELSQTAARIQRHGRRVMAIRTDVSRPDDVRALVERTIETFGAVDVLVNAAGIQGPIGPLVDNDIEEWIESVHINLVGVFLGIRAVLPGMMARRRGKIINFSGGGAAAPREYFTSYGAAKAGVVRLTESLAAELRPHNIQVNAIAPGACNTRMLDAILGAGARAGARSVAETERQVQDGGTPLHVPSALASFLASEDSGMLSGRLLSAVHDDVPAIASLAGKERLADAYTLRRVDTYTLRRLNPDWRLPIDDESNAAAGGSTIRETKR